MKQQFLVCLLVASVLLASISPNEALPRRGIFGRRGFYGRRRFGLGGFGAGLLLGGLLGYGYGSPYGQNYSLFIIFSSLKTPFINFLES